MENCVLGSYDCWHTTEASLEALELNDENAKNGNVDSSLFAKGSRMQSYWNRPGNPTQIATATPILKSLKNVLEGAGLEALISFPVVHCSQAFGVALKAANRMNKVGKTIPGWKIVYSGHARPCPEITKASDGATVLIHEASHET